MVGWPMEELSIPPIFKMAESSRARSQPSSSHPQVIIPNASVLPPLIFMAHEPQIPVVGFKITNKCSA